MKRNSLPLAARTIFPTALVAVLVAATFGVMLLAVSAFREAERREAHSRTSPSRRCAPSSSCSTSRRASVRSRSRNDPATTRG